MMYVCLQAMRMVQKCEHRFIKHDGDMDKVEDQVEALYTKQQHISVLHEPLLTSD